jgi:hypothetical protein
VSAADNAVMIYAPAFSLPRRLGRRVSCLKLNITGCRLFGGIKILVVAPGGRNMRILIGPVKLSDCLQICNPQFRRSFRALERLMTRFLSLAPINIDRNAKYGDDCDDGSALPHCKHLFNEEVQFIPLRIIKRSH